MCNEARYMRIRGKINPSKDDVLLSESRANFDKISILENIKRNLGNLANIKIVGGYYLFYCHKSNFELFKNNFKPNFKSSPFYTINFLASKNKLCPLLLKKH